MAMWVFGYGSLIWKAGFNYDEKLFGFIKGYRRVFHQGSTDHRGTPAFPGRTVTLEPVDDDDGQVCWGVAYKVSGEENQKTALSVSNGSFFIHFNPQLSDIFFMGLPPDNWVQYLEVREKQYDMKVNLDFYTDSNSTTPVICGVLVYVASPDTRLNPNYLGPAALEDMAKQIIQAEGPSGPNRDYLFQLEEALNQFGFEDLHVRDLANEVRNILSGTKTGS